MQLKMLKAPHAGQTDMLVQTKFGTREFQLGKAQEVPADEAAAIFDGPHGGCFERVPAVTLGGGTKVTAEGKAVVHAAQQTVKKPEVEAEDEAALEATKVVSSKDYKKK